MFSAFHAAAAAANKTPPRVERTAQEYGAAADRHLNDRSRESAEAFIEAADRYLEAIDREYGRDMTAAQMKQVYEHTLDGVTREPRPAAQAEPRPGEAERIYERTTRDYARHPDDAGERVNDAALAVREATRQWTGPAPERPPAYAPRRAPETTRALTR